MNVFIFLKKWLALSLFLVVLMAPQSVFSQGGDNATAAAAAPVTLPFSSTGTTCGHVDNYNPLSPYGITPDGKDWLYYFCAPTSGVIDIMMSNAYGTPPAIMVYNTVPNATGSNWLSTTFTGANYMNSILSVTATAGSCYYVMIDNYPTATFTETCISYSLTIQYHVNQPAAPLQPACSNIGYDSGNLSGWVGTTGAVNIGAAGAPTPSYIPMYYGTTAQQHSVTSGAGTDPYGGFPIVNPAGGPNSLRLGDFGNFGTTGQFLGGVPGACGATLEQKFTVTASNALFVYYYAVVIQDAGTDHTNQEQPFFKTDIFDCSGNAVACGQYLVTGGPGIPGFTLSGAGSNVYYKNWSPVAVDLTPYIGTCVTVRYTVGDCTRGAHFAYAYIDASCSPLAITGINQICPTKNTTLTAPVGLFTYSWTPGGQTTQSVVVSPTVATNYTCELTSYTNCKTFLTYSVSLFPAATVSASSQTVCNGTAATLTTSVNNPGGTYAWLPGGGASASNVVSPGTTTNYTCTYTDPNGCQDTAMGRVTVNPLPNMATPPNVTVCNSATIAPSAFTSTVAGTTYSWTNSNASIGLAANGSGDTPGFTATNTGTSPVTAIISVTPSANSCVGPPVTYSITVNPIPNVNAVASGTYCSGTLVPATAFSGSVTSTTYSWTNTNAAIGLTTSGTGNTPAFTSTNTGSSGISGVITVTPGANSCIGVPTNYTVLVNPVPTVTAVPSATYCSGTAVPATTFTGNIAAATYSWVNSNTGIGAGAAGSANVPSFTAGNTTASGISGVITVTPSANSCVGAPTNYTITVNPIPVVNAVPGATYCSGIAVPSTAFTGSVISTSYSWTNTNPAIGLTASGAGNTPVFTATNSGASGISGVVTVTPSANSCIGTPTNYTITVNPLPTVNAVPGATYCSGVLVPAVTFTGSTSGATYNWTNSNTVIGIAASGAATVPAFTATNSGASGISGVISVTPSANSCIGAPINYTVLVNPIPMVNALTSATYCNGDAVPAVTFSGNVASATYSWTNSNSAIGAGTSGTATVPGFNATNSGSSLISGVITVTPSANSCIGAPANYTLAVNPTPVVNAVPGATYCSGAPVATLTFTGNVATATYNWSNSNPTIGTAANGVATMPSFIATNTSASGISAVITVTPSANSCVGAPTNFTLVVNPIPTVSAVPGATYCNGANVPATTFTGNVAGATYNWTNSNTTIGAPGSGTSTVPVFTAANTTLAGISGVITVTPSANSCVGTPMNYTLFVNPTPTVMVPPNAVYCAGSLVPASTFTSNLATTVFDWSNSASSIGLGASGTGNIPSFTSINNTAASVPAVISVTPSANSCIGAVQLFTITVNPNPVAPTVANATICPGSSATLTATAPGPTYQWYDAPVAGNLLLSNAVYTTPSLTTSTRYYVNTTNAFGCVSPMTPVDVTVLNFLAVNTSSNQTICAGQTASLSVTPNGAGFTSSWDAPGNAGFSTAPSLTVSPATTTNYSVTVTSSNGCSGVGQTFITVNQLPIANAGSPVAFCQNQSGNIGSAAVAGYSYSWSPATGLSSTSVSNPQVTLSNTGTTAATTGYTLTVTLNGCVASNTTAATVNPLPVSEAGSSMTLCAVQNGTIGAANTTGYAYTWSPATNLSSATAADPTVTGVNNGLIPIVTHYTVTTTETATSCQSSDDVVVTVLPLPNVNAGAVAASCEGTTGLPLNGTAGGSVSGVLWSGGAGSFHPNNTTAIATYDPAASEYANGSVTLTLTAIALAPCQNVSSPVVIGFYKKPAIAYTVDVPKGCPVHCVNFTDQSTVASPDVIQAWSWNFGDGNSGSDQNPAHCYSQTGLYNVTLTATSNHQCTSSLSISQMIEVYEQPDADFSANPQSVGVLDPIINIQDNSQNAFTYLWNFGDQFATAAANTSTVTNPTHAYTNSGEYVIDLLVTSVHGCTDRASVIVEVLPEFTFYIPNAFTPNNGDGLNDLFTGAGIGIEKYEMWIFDRWGERIYYTDDIRKGWDGRRQGKSDVVQQDVYIWKVKLKDVFEKSHEYIGHVTLLK
jgi:gliding motility-associated-like protein